MSVCHSVRLAPGNDPSSLLLLGSLFMSVGEFMSALETVWSSVAPGRFILMGELPIFTCQAHVFTINPETKKSWIPSSQKAVDVNFFYDSNKHCYRIISVENVPGGGKKVIINSTLTEKMAFKKTSQKFGQWADSKTGSVHGLGFNSETELTEFVNHFKQYVEATKGSPSTSSSSNGRPTESCQRVSNGGSISQNGGQLLSSVLPPGAVNSITHTTLQAPPSLSLSSPNSAPSPQQSETNSHSVYLPQTSLQLQQQLRQAQAQVKRLEAELNASKRQTAGITPPMLEADGVPAASRTSGSEGDNPELRDCLTRLDLNGTLGGVAIEDWKNGAGSPNFQHADGKSVGSNLQSNSGPNRNVWGDRYSDETVRSLHARLGYILREAVELHTRLGILISHSTPGAPPE
ncbi:unnamed protein product [Calicophoron daubneyi]|uniref:WH1 domain-containing protein n=1 Tax=Calicophoron daubneyi TaxID=300641 RepID=A0AAV2TMP5_CALDB